jgi:hypothetical protein
MKNKIWLMEGLSSQRDIIQGMKSFAKFNNFNLVVYASHRQNVMNYLPLLTMR